ncbi:unnamed protein product, partial [Ectocarpus fasciculatus]
IYHREILYLVLLLVLVWILLHLIVKALVNFAKGAYEPAEKAVDIHVNGVHYAVSYWTVQGGRPYQEDRHTERQGKGLPDSCLYGVFDGHGGHNAAEYCRSNMIDNILSDEKFETDVPGALYRAFLKTDADFVEYGKRRGVVDGTTAVVVSIHDNKIHVANAGDSRAILIQRGGKVKSLSFDHKPSREDEGKRIRDLGGRVIFWGRWRVEGVLAVSRGIGDVRLKPYVTSEPEITVKTIEENDLYVVVASDGLWDVMQNDEVGRVVTSCKNFLTVAQALCDEATLLGSTDNITVQVINLKM